ncbi:ABC-F family ATP-binding cassette domain-containing protein [Aerococcaceae bacterium DSM 111020]|nr:ABC-F family ATP-binding cassette domain-containing protein [Aerococcaceae bacterium DSM 111020]
MLHIKQLNLTHRKDSRELIKNLDLLVNVGDKLAIIGEEGNGKSSLLKYMMGDPSIEDYLIVTGQIRRNFSHFGYLAQSLNPKDLDLTIEEYFFKEHSIESLNYNLLYQIEPQLGFEVDRLYSNQKVGTLSGGERIKLQLLTLLMAEPDILFLDEPSNDLDIYSLEWLQGFIQASDKTIVFVSHDESLLRQAATSILHLEIILHRTQARHSYRALDFGTYSDNRQRDFDYQERIARKQRAEDRARMARHQQISNKVKNQLQKTKNDVTGRLLAKKFKNIKSQAKRFDRERKDFVDLPIQEDAIRLEFKRVNPINASKTIIQLDNVSLEVAGRLLAHSINLTWQGQDKIAIVGANGVGKSSLLKLIKDNIQNKEGFQVGYMAQNYNDQLLANITPIDYLTQIGSKEERSQIMTFLGSLRFTSEEMKRPITELSGGQRAKLLLANLSLQIYNILLLDEPTRNISPTSQAQLRQTFADYPGAILTVSHDRLFIREVCDRAYELTEDGLVLIDEI